MDDNSLGSTTSRYGSEPVDIGIGSADLGDVIAPAHTHLFDLGQLDVSFDERSQTLWTFMTPEGRPSFNLAMLRDFRTWQTEISRLYGSGETELKYLVLGSRFPNVFSFGGDLNLFAGYIRAGDRISLVEYGRACVSILHRNMNCLGLPIVTIGLVQGEALGGGFEALLSFNVLIAEKSARFGLPEIAFGLFPGMGAHSLLTRKIGAAIAERMVLSGETFSAQEMYELGIVHTVVEDGEGEAAVESYIRANSRRHAGNAGAFRAAREVDPVSLDELNTIVDIWADTALKLREKDLKLMTRLVNAQTRLSDGLGV